MKHKFLENSMMHRLFLTILVALTLLVSSCGTPHVETPASEKLADATPEQTITIGIVSDDPATSIMVFQPLAGYLAKELSTQNILASRVVVTSSLEEMFFKLKSGEVDIFLESPYGAYQAYEQAGAIPLLRRWKGGIGEYYSVIVVLKSSDKNSLSDLPGSMIAFEDQTSTSGYILPTALLLEQGFTLNEKVEANSGVAANEIGYFFTGSNENSIALLLANRVSAAAIQFDDYEELPADQKDQTKMIAQTRTVPRHLVMVSSTMPSALLTALETVLLDMENSEDGRAVLESAEKTTRFEKLPLGADETMSQLKELFRVAH